MRIIQVLDALDYGDGVSNDVINKFNLLIEMGYQAEIYSKWTHKKVSAYWRNIDNLAVKNDDILLHHFSGESHILNEVLRLKCTKVLVYHNITPEKYFSDSLYGQGLSKGEDQLKKIYKNYDFYIGDSDFNIDCLKKIGVCIGDKMDVLPIFVDFSRIEILIENKIKDKCSNTNEMKNFLFVGRVAPNKKHEDIIDIFEYYYKNIDCNIKLIFVGNYADYMDYYTELKSKINTLTSSENIIFTGKVDDNKLYECYSSADVFICMSEHEGFCLPLLESMYCGLPTIAYEAGAIMSTMGNSGILIEYKSEEKIAKLIYTIVSDYNIRNQIVEKQYKWIEKFSKNTIEQQLVFLINKWTGGNIH